MGLLDRWFKKPEVKRLPRRPARSFDGAKTDRLMFGFTTTPQHVNADLKVSWGALVARARELAKNDDYVRRFMRVARNNILGPQGIQLQARSVFTSGVKRGEPDSAANEAVETSWKAWSKRGHCDVTGRHSWRDVQCMVVDSVMRDGEAIVQLVPGYGNDHRFAVQLMDVASLPWDYNEEFRGNKVVMGVELDAVGRPVAYHFRSSDQGTTDYYNTAGKGYIRIPAVYSDGSPRIIHMFRGEEVDQVRGFSGLASAIARLKMLSGYEEATLVAARIGASQMLFFEQGEGAAEYQGDDQYADGAPIDEIEPGIARTLPPGWKAHAYDPKQPTTQYVDFTKQTLRGIAAGLGLSYITLANDLESVNYSSARVGVLEDREEWKGVQAWFVESLCQPVFESWLRMALLANQVTLASGAPLPVDRYDKLLRVHWMPRRWDWVDPLKDMQANKLAIELGVRTVSDVIRERGQDPDDVFAEKQREKQRMAELGITPAEVMEEADNAQDEETTED